MILPVYLKQLYTAIALLLCFCVVSLHAQSPVMVKDIYPGSVSGVNASSDRPIVNINGTVYFVGTDQTYGDELWRSDGTEVGTVLVKDIYSGSGSSSPANLVAVNGKLFFYAYDPQSGYCLFKSDGTEAGTVKVKELNYYYGQLRYLTDVNGTLFFTYNNGSQGNELWKSDGTTAGTVLVKDINSGSNSSSPINLINVSGTLYFFASDAAHGQELWKSDGTETGTVLVKDIEPGTKSGVYDQLIAVGSQVFFIGSPYVNNYPDYELWKSDGTEAGTAVVKNLTPGSTYNSYITSLLAFNSTLYFKYNYSGEQLWKTDGTESGTVKVFPTQSQGVAINYLTKSNNLLYFFDGSNRLWKSNGSTEGTVLVKTFSNGFSINASNNGALVGIENSLYFQGNQSSTGYELWKSDGTEAGTIMLPEIQPGTSSSYPGNFVDVNGGLFFTATTDLYGKELYALKTCQLPTITTQPPSSSAVCAGGTVTASVTASGTGLTYQWYNNSSQPISAATTATLTLTNVQSSQDGKYRCKITNSCGSTTSDPLSLSISSPPVISQQPNSQNVCNLTVGQTGSVSFYASVPGNYLTYQWETRPNASSPWVTLNNETHASGNQAVSGATTYYVNITSYSPYFQDGQQFRVNVTAATCPDVVYSNPATLNIITPVIITQPTDQVICGETSAKFRVVANTAGGATLTYQWQYYDSSYGWRAATSEGFSGYSTSELTVSGAQLVNGRLFQAYVYSSICGNYYSSQVALTTGGGVTINNQPTSQTVCSSSSAVSFSVAATASGSIQYRWQWQTGVGSSWQDLSDGNGISGATTANLAVSSSSFYFSYYNNAQYRVKMTTTTGSCPGDLYSDPANLTRDNGPTITVQPTYQNYVCTGGMARISVAATGNGTLTYQWYKYNQTEVSGATSATLTLTNPQPEPGYTDYAGWYVCRVTNSCTTITSGAAYIYLRTGAPTISYQPVSQTICSTNGSVNFYSSASGNDQAQWETRADNNSPWISLTNNTTGISGAETAGNLYVSSSSSYFRAGQQFRLRVSTTCSNTPVYSDPATLFFYNAITFNSQPAGQTVCVGATSTFSAVTSSDNRYYTYSWQYNDGPGWVPIFGNTQEFQGYNQNQLTVSGSQIINGRKFRLLATDNSCGSTAYSDEASLSVINGVTVTTQPTNQTTCTDGTISFSIVAESSQAVSYQWQWRYGDNYPWQDITNGSGYAGVTTSNLTVTGNGLIGGSQVRVKLQSDACPTPSYTNSASVITISPPYIYSNPPSSQTICDGTSVTAELRAYYNRPGENYITDNTLTYQWYRNNTIVSGATSATLSILNTTTASAGEYKAIITNACGSVTSGSFTLYLTDAPLISSQPNTVYEYCPGATSGIQLNASVYGQNLTFQWETRASSTAAWEPTPPNSQTGVGSYGVYKQPYYTVGSDLFQDGRQFRLKAGSANCLGITYTNPTTISIYKSATFSTQPTSQTVCASGATSFSAVAVNPYSNNSYFYTVWQYFDGTNWQVANVTGMSGYASSQLTVSGAAVVNGRRFRLLAYNLYFNCVQAYSDEATVTTIDAVAIIAHPTNQTACSTTGMASFSVAATGADSQYQWETGSGSTWTPLTNTNGVSGATTAMLTINPGSYLVNGQQFRVKLTTPSCPTPAYSNAAMLNLLGVPNIYFGPSPDSQIVCVGSQAGATIQATSSLPLTYQWYLGATPVAGATQNSLLITNVQAVQAGAYTAQVSNVCGTVTSLAYSLSISQSPTVTSQPQPLTVCAGHTNNAIFSVAAIGQTLNYQWQTRANSTASWGALTDAVNGQGVTLLTGAATPSLNVRSASEFYTNGQQFRVRIYTVACQQEVFSNAVALNLRGPLLITAQPTSVTVCNEGTSSFSIIVDANSTGTPTYQWQYLDNTTWTSIGANSNGFGGVGTSELTVSGFQLVNGRKFRVLVYGNQCGGNAITSAEAALSVINGIAVAGQPASQTVCNSGTASFTVAATADEVISYQWESFNNNAWTIATNANGLSGATSATLTVTGAALNDGRQFRVKLNTISCPAALYSNAATLAVAAPATVASDLPASFTVCPNSTNEQVAVTANGVGLIFDWQTRANDTAAWVTAPIQYVYPNSSNSSRYQFPGSAFPDGQQFRVQITSSVCSSTTYSQIATLTLRQAPTITVQPASLTFCTDAAVTFSVSTTSNNTGYSPQYDWQYLDGSLWVSASGNGFTGQGTSQLTVSGVQVVEGRRFRVVVGDGFGNTCLATTSNEATLITGTPAVITSQPVSQTALPNSLVNFVVSATGTNGTLSYQWESRATATDTWTTLTDGSNISGVTTSTLTVSYGQQNDGRQFRIKLSSTSCSTPIYSDIVTLNIKTPDLAIKSVTSDRTTVGPNDVVTVSWSIANDGSATSTVDWSERIYLQSPAGANRTLIKQVTFANSNLLSPSQSIPRSETLIIPAQLLIEDQAVFVVEVVPGSSIQEAPGTQANNIGIQQSAWSIKRDLAIALSASEITEGNVTGLTATVSRTGSLANSLTVTIGVSNPSRFSYPTSVVIPAGQSGVSFTLSVPDNSIIEGKITYQLQVSAAGYQGAQTDVVVLDNDTPTLSIVNLPASAVEGETVTFNVTTNLAPSSPLIVFLQSSSPARFPIPASITIPTGSLSAVVSVTLAQNNTPEIDLAVTITAGASNYNPATNTIQVKDDDLPNLELVILAGNISESAGANATQAVLRRTSSSSSIAFTANLSASLPNTLLLPGAISLAEGENEKTFTIGVVDNSVLDGQRLVTVTASLFVASCGCNAPPTSSGSVSATVIVNDDDGPSLTLTASQQTLLEGLVNAGTLRITRNGATTDALSVTLISSDITEATLPATVIIPAGQAFVDVAITTIDDGITDGNQTVYFTATAFGLSPGSTFVVVTDLNKPDLQIPLVQLTSDKVQAGSDIAYQVSVRNSGSATAPSGILVRGYLSIDNVIDASDILLSEDVIGEAISASQTKIISKSVKASDNQGLYKLIFWVNPNATLAELLLTNNVSTPISVTIEPSYTATATVGPTYFLQGNNVPVTGSATKLNGSPATNVPVEIYVLTQGVRRVVSVVTDGSGNYSTAFTPSANEAGHYNVGANPPGSNQTTVQDEFDILGVRINDGNTPRFELVQNETVSGVLKVQNLSDKNLTGFTIKPINLPGGVSMQFGIIAQLGGNTTADLSYQIVGSTLSTGDNFNVVNFEATANEGIIQKQKLYYYCQSPSALVVANVTSFETAVSQTSKERITEIKLFNKGKGATGNVAVNLPADANWINSVTPKVLPSIMPGDSSLVTLRFLAVDEVPFDSPINSSIGIATQNGNSFTIPFVFKKVAEAKGSASITATNQFTYFADGHPNVQGAKVRIENYFTGELYVEGITDASGVFNASGVPEGKHRVIVEKEKHKGYNGTILINPGLQSQSTAFLEYQAVTYTWKVVPTTVQDQYDITLETKFETNIPMPVVTIDLPDSVPQLSAGQQYSFMVTLTNHGLITAKDVVLNLPQDDPEYEFITNYITADLLAQQSIQVPVVMRRRSGSGRISYADGRQVSTANASGELFCRFAAGVNYWYQCAKSIVVGSSTAKPVNYAGRCGSSGSGGGGGGGGAWTEADIIRYINQYNYWAQIAAAYSEAFRGNGSCGNCGPTGTPKPYELPKWMTEKKSCQDCIKDIVQAVNDCTPVPANLLLKVAKCSANVYIQKKGPLDYAKCLAKPLIEREIIKKYPDYKDIKGILKRLFCVESLFKAVTTCLRVENSSSKDNSANAREIAYTPANGVYKEIASNLQIVAMAYNTQINWNREYFGEMIYSDGWEKLNSIAEPYMDDLKSFDSDTQDTILAALDGYDISPSTLKAFFNRWNTSITARDENVLRPTVQYPDIINWTLVKAYSDSLVDNHNYAVSKGLEFVEYMHSSSVESLNEIIDGQKDDVCASVSVQFNQQLTMTREAFEGTLEVTNGHPTDAMKNISVNIQITDENGTPSNGLFEIQPQTPANLADINAQQSGSVKFIFIPEVGAAPQASKIYKFGGSISYFDPYAQAVVTLPLAAVPITVNPSPNLMLHYFMERNILGDDPLTSPDVEPSVPAELAVMVENQGYGPARDLTISSAQPKIVDNEKGLAINFNLIGSNFQGQPKHFGLTNINFGEIPAQQTRIGQWYFTSSLLGKFVSYDAKVVHNSSFGNKDLSLIQSVKLHELTKSIQIYGDLDDGITDFLVNDIFDVNDQPDIIYFSQGNRTAKVSPATSGSFNAPVSGPTFTNTLTVTPSEAGFNYIKLPDPGNRLFELVSVTRNDGQVIPLNNAWLTFVTLPVSRSPIYENKFHIVDNFVSTIAATYTVVWKPKDNNMLKVDSVAGAPIQVSSTQVKNLKVYFNRRINPATFTYEDLTLTLQGGQNIINSSVLISQLDTASFNIDLSAITTENGLYTFTAQAANVKDVYGVSGTAGKQVSWSQFIDGLSFTGLQSSYCSNATSQTLVGIPSGGTFGGPGISGNVFDPIVAGIGSHTITYSKNGVSISQITAVYSPPDLSISPSPTTLTCAKPTAILTAISSTTGLSYSWSGPDNFTATSYTATVSTVGVYSVTARSANGCTAVASTTVTGDATLPIATLANSGPLSCSTTSVTLTSSGGTSYSFSSGATQVGITNTATVTTAGVYSVTAVSASGCTAVASTTVSGDAILPIATLANNGPLSCSTTSVTLTAGGVGAGASYTFSSGAIQVGTTNTATVSLAGVYSVTARSANGCIGVAYATITKDVTLPVATLANNGPLSCSATSVTLTAGGVGAGASYTFSSGATQVGTTSTATLIVEGVYSVTARSASGCTATASTTVSSNTALPIATISGNLTVTSAGSTGLTASGGTSQIWSTGETTASISVTAGTYSVTVTNASGCSSSTSVTVTQAPTNTAPVATINGSQTATVGVPFSYVVSAFTDAETPSGLTYSASINPVNGLSFDPATRTISGTPSLSGVSSITVIVTDPGSLSASTTFSITVSPAPVVVTPLALTVTASPTMLSTSGTTTLSATVSGGTTPYSYSFTGPGTITPSGNTASVSGIPAGVQTYTVAVRDATSPTSQTIAGTVSVTVSAANTAPVATTNASQTATVGMPFTYLVNAFTDSETPNGLTYSASISPTNGLSFDPVTRIISGTPSLSGVSSITITVTDPGSLSASTSFTITVNPAPVAGNIQLSVLHQDASFGQTTTNTILPYLQLANSGSAPIAYSTITVRYWLTVEGNSPITNFQHYYVQIGANNVHERYVPLATPRQGATAYVEYSFDAAAGNLGGGTNSGPIQNGFTKGDYSAFEQSDDYSYVANRDYTANARITAYVNGVLVYGQEPPGTGPVTPLMLSLTANPTMLTTSGTTTLSATVSGGTTPYSYTFSGPGTITPSGNTATVSNLPAGVQTFTVLVRDATSPTSQTISGTVNVTVSPANTAPVATMNANQTATVGVAFSYMVNAFSDAETPNQLTYSASINPVNGLSFDPATRTISGTPSLSGVSSITVIVTDPGSLSASTTFSITVSPAPVVVTPLALTVTASPTMLSTSGTTTLSATVSGGTTPYSYSFTGPGTITPSGNTASVSNLPAGVQTYTVVVRDATSPTSQTISGTVNVTVSAANTAPVATTNGSQTATVGVPFSYVVSAFTDAETPSGLTYSASINPVNGLSFDPATRTISGTPSLSGVSSITVIVTDPGSLSASTTFSITVSPAPVVVTPLALTVTASPTMLSTSGTTTLSATVSGGTTPYSYSFTGPGTITPSGNTASVSGIPAGVQTYTVAVRDATSPTSQTIAGTVSVTVSAANTAPVATTNASQTATVGMPFTYLVNAFTDSETPNGLTYSASISPTNGLSFDPVTRIISGTPSLSGVSSITITVTDPGSLSASTSFTITVNPAPVAGNIQLSVLHQDASFGQTTTNTILPYLQLANSGSAPIAYSTITVRYWLTVEGNSPITNFQHYYVQIGANNVHERYVPLATPRQGATAYVEYSFDAAAGNLGGGTNSGPIQNGFTKGDYSAFEQSDDYSYVANRDYTANARITAYVNGVLVYGQEPPGTGPVTPLMLSLTANPTMLTTSGTTTLSATVSGGTTPYSYTFSGPGTITPSGNTATVSNLPAGVQTFTVLVRDATSPTSQTISGTVNVTVSPANTAPVATMNANQTATVGVAFSYMVNAFTDSETPNQLTYSASISPANGFSFDPATRILSGMPSMSGVSSVTVTATDPGSLSASTSFSITVSPAPVVITPLALTVTASPTMLTISGTTTLSATVSGGTTPYSYSFTGPGTITPSGNTASVSGIPAGVQTYTVAVRDATSPTSQTIAGTVSVTVSAANTAPVATTNASQTATVGMPFTYLVNAFTDSETPNGLTYSASISPTNGLSFDPVTRIISGTPSLSGVSSITITVTDPGSLSASTSFTITVNPAPVAGNIQLSVLHQDASFGQTTTNTILPYLQLANSGSAPIAYSTITVRYWLTVEGNSPITNFQHYYVQIGANNVHERYVPLATPRQGATAYVEYSFDAAAGNLGGGTNSGPIQNGFTKADYSAFNQSDDYSYVANRDYTANARITAYVNGVLVYGQEPPVGLRVGATSSEIPLRVRVLGNPVVNEVVEVMVSGGEGQSLLYQLTDARGQVVGEQRVDQAGSPDHQRFKVMGQSAGMLLLRVSTPTQSQTVKVIKGE